MAADLTSLSAVLKEFYVSPLAEQLNQDVMVTQLLRVDSENLEGLKAVIALHSGRSGGIGSRAEGADLPAAGNQAYKRAEFDLKYHYARVQVSGPSISKTKSERGAFLQALKSELEYIRNDLQLDQARQFYGDGSGVLGVVASEVGSTLTLESSEALSKGWIYIGQVVDGGAPATPTDAADGDTVVDIDVDLAAVELSTDTGGFSAGDVLVVHDNVTDTTDLSTNAEIDAGLVRLLGTSTVGGLNPATAGQSFWQANVDDKSGAPDINLDDLMIMSNELANAGGQGHSTVMTTPGLVRRLFGSPDFKDSIRFVNSTTLKGGFESLSFAAGNGPMTIHSDRLAPWGQVLFVDKRHVKVFSPADWDFLARDGLTVRWVPDKDAFQAILFRYANLGTDRRNSSGRIHGYTDTGF